MARPRRSTVSAQLLLASAGTTRYLRACSSPTRRSRGRQYRARPGRARSRPQGTGAELFRSAGGHYDVYEGGASFADVLRTEVDFLHRHVKTAAQKLS